MHTFLVAIGFLTRVPVPEAAATPDAETLRAAVRRFPLVGLCVGAVTGAVALGLDTRLPVVAAVVLALALEARLTGAMHEDALADCGDALGGGWTRERVLEIFKDSRLGTYGVLALVLGLLLRLATTTQVLLQSDAWTALAWIASAAALGRLAVLVALWRVPPMPGRAGLASEMGQGHRAEHVALAALPLLPGLLWLGWQEPLRLAVGLVLAAVSVALFLQRVRRRLGGTTGDVLGACAYVAQLGLLLGAVLER